MQAFIVHPQISRFSTFYHDESFNGLAYGVGIDVDLGRHVTLSFDLTGYDSDMKAAGAGLMLKGRF